MDLAATLIAVSVGLMLLCIGILGLVVLGAHRAGQKR